MTIFIKVLYIIKVIKLILTLQHGRAVLSSYLQRRNLYSLDVALPENAVEYTDRSKVLAAVLLARSSSRTLVSPLRVRSLAHANA